MGKSEMKDWEVTERKEGKTLYHLLLRDFAHAMLRRNFKDDDTLRDLEDFIVAFLNARYAGDGPWEERLDKD
jgi:hypothetical protein